MAKKFRLDLQTDKEYENSKVFAFDDHQNNTDVCIQITI